MESLQQIKQKNFSSFILMKTKVQPTKKQTLSRKTDYSHIESRLFSSLSKSRQKPSFIKQQIPYKSIKQSIQKVEQIGQQKYKQAMKHMHKFSKYEEEIKKRKIMQNQFIDSQCTFKPKLYNTKKYTNQTSRFMTTSFTQRYLQKNKEMDPQKKDFNQNKITSKNNEKLNKNNYNQTHQTQMHNSLQKNQSNLKRKSKGIQLADRLIRWAKDRDMKVMNKTIQLKVNKSISRKSSFTQRKSSTLQKEGSYSKLHAKKLTMKESTSLNQAPEKQFSQKFNQITPITQRPNIQYMGRSIISIGSDESTEFVKKCQIPHIDFSKIDQNQSFQKGSVRIKREKMYTEITPFSKNISQTVGQKILSRQVNRGEGSFYLRQAKANIIKNCQKTDLLMKNNQYSKRFANQSNIQKNQLF